MAHPGFFIAALQAVTPKKTEQIQADAQRRAEREACRQAQMQNRTPNQNSPAAPND
jgi:hypothetical protein